MFTETDLWPAEQDLWASVVRQRGESTWSAEQKSSRRSDNKIRAELVRELAMSHCGQEMLGSPILNIEDKIIVGDIDLEATRLSLRLQFNRCTIDSLNLDQADMPDLIVIDSTMKRLTANQLGTRTILLRGTTVTDGVSLVHAHLQGFLNLEDTQLGAIDPPGGRGFSLDAHSLEVEGDFLAYGLSAEGTVDITGAQIGGYLELATAHLSTSGGVALSGNGLSVKQDMLCSDLVTRGAVHLNGARIDGRLILVGAAIREVSSRRAAGSEAVPALSGNFLSVGREMRCGSDFSSHELDNALRVDGDVCLSSAEIKGRLDVSEVTFPGYVNLESASVHFLLDKGTQWPERISLRNFRYESFGDIDEAGSVNSRLDWLKKDPNYSPQIYDVLARAYRADGQDQAVRKVLVEKLKERSLARRKKLRREKPSSGPKRFLIAAVDRFLRGTVGYGYRPLWIIWWFLAMAMLGWFLFTAVFPLGIEVKSSDSATNNRASSTPFFALFYTFDLLLPLADLGHRAGFTASGAALTWTTIFTLLGWLFGLTLVAGISGVFKRD